MTKMNPASYAEQAHRMYEKYTIVQEQIEAIERAMIQHITKNNPHIKDEIHIKKAASAQLRKHDEYVMLTGDRAWMMATAQLNATMAQLP